MADAAGSTVWRWDQAEPFGANPASDDPDGNSVDFDLPLRLPGQRYDAETALHYNYFREYDPSLGAYKESDLVGLRAGLNTYAYLAGNPLRLVDPLGLAASQGMPDYIGGLNGKAAEGLVDEIIIMLGHPDTAGHNAAAKLCQRFHGNTPKFFNLNADCTAECYIIQGMLPSQSLAASGWLIKCTKSCEEYFPKCHKVKTSCL